MQFCPDCENMLYSRIEIEEDKQVLKNICRRCGWKDTKARDSLVHVTKPSGERIRPEILDVAFGDPAVPVVNVVPCINDKCPSKEDGQQSVA